MIKNTPISLFPTSKLRIDAVNSIKYTLLLNYELPDMSNSKTLISQLMTSCHNCCSGLFSDNPQNHSYYFFGSLENFNKSALGYLDIYSPDSNIYNPCSDISFSKMILQHSVLSSYHTIVSDLLNEFSKESYYIANTIGNHGVQYLLRKGALDINNNAIDTNSISNYQITNSKKSAIASDFMRTSKTHLKNIPHISELFEVTCTNPKSIKYYIQFAGLYSQICEISATKWRGFYQRPTKSTLPSLLEKLCNFPKTLNSGYASNHVDCLYHKYLFERIFDFNLINCLLQNINKVEYKTTYRFSSKYFLDILCECQKLPNTFSRPYFIQYAFDKFFNTPNSGNNFWYQHLRPKTNELIYSLDGLSLTFEMPLWLQQFRYFCRYMTDFVIPIYEWCFTDMLLSIIEQKNPKDTHLNHLKTAIEVLATYMDENFKSLENPYSGSKLKELIVPQKNLDHINLPLSYYEIIFDNFFQKKPDLDLNLKAMGPDFFIKDTHGQVNSDKTKIRDFYIGLIKDKYLVNNNK